MTEHFIYGEVTTANSDNPKLTLSFRLVAASNLRSAIV